MEDSSFKRKYIRFTSDENQVAWISKNIEEFSPDFLCLADQESYGGCKVVTNQNVQLHVGDLCLLKVGNLAPMVSEVKWVKEISRKVFTLGFEFKE